MKKLLIVFIGLILSIFSNVSAQTVRITYPLNRTVFQQNSLGNANVPISIQISGPNLGLGEWAYTIDKLDAKTGTIISGGFYRYELFPVTQAGTFKFINESPELSKGWYRLTVGFVHGRPDMISHTTSSSIVFGVGDVYFVAGQSNSSGFDEEGDNVQNFGESYPSNEQYESVSYRHSGYYINRSVNGYGRLDILGMPVGIYKQDAKIGQFERLGNTANDRIYPNGRGPWYWSRFAYRMAKDKDTPVMLFNIGIPNQSVAEWGSFTKPTNSNWESVETNSYKQLRRTLQLYGSILGIKAVLWHQGENDTRGFLNWQSTNPNQASWKDIRYGTVGANGSTNRQDYLNSYKQFLEKTATYLNSDVKGSSSWSLPWFTSKVSYANGLNSWLYPPSDPSFTFFNSTCGIDMTNVNGKILSNDIRNSQGSTVNHNNKRFLGIETDDIDECKRSALSGLHLTGVTNSFEIAGDKWYDAVNNFYSSAVPQTNSGLLPITVSKNTTSGLYTVSAPVGYVKYIWVKNGGSPYSTDANIVVSTNRVYQIPNSNQNFSNPDHYTCYVTSSIDPYNSNNFNLKMCQPFVVLNNFDANNSLSLSSNAINYPSVNSEKAISIFSSNVRWDISNLPIWINVNQTDGLSGITSIKLTAQANNSSNQRTAVVNVKEKGTNAYLQTLTITQAAAGGTTTPLSSLTPTSVSQGYGTLQTNKSVEGNTLRIGGQSFSSGLGTHAASNIKYNLGGQYTTFSGKVGLDDQVDNSCGGLHQVQFVVKADGSTLFTSPVVTPTMAAVPFSVNVSGKTQLELIVEPLANYYCDHADWVDVQLVSGGGGGCPIIASPTGVNANPGTLSAGQSSTLSASCSQGSVVWSTGQTANSITVSPTASTTYTATCISGTCSSGSVSVTVVVASAGSCSNLTDGLVVGTWLQTGQPLKVREFHGQKWLTQSAGTNPDVFVVRGSNMFLRSDVLLTNSSYASQMACFAWQNSGWDGLGTPTSSTFPTPSGYTLGYAPDGTPVYTASGTPPTCTNSYLTAAGASYSSSGDGVVRTNLNKAGGTLNINGTTYAKGLGTHSVSEIIYTVPSGQGFTTFTADVGRDQGSYGCNCGNQDMVFKVVNAATDAILAGPVTKGNYQSATTLTANLSGVSSIKLIVEAGSDGLNWGDWANWANARLTCPNANARQINTETTELFQILPNPNNGTFNVRIDAKMAGVVQFYLSNLNGIPLKNFEFNVELGVSEHTVSVENLLPSTYLLKAIQGEKVEAKRLVIE